MISFSGNKALQFKKLAASIDITPIQDSRFFYAIDCFKTVELKNRILDNYTIEYDMVVNFSIDDLLKMDTHLGSAYTNQEKAVVSALQMYLERVKKNAGLNVQYGEAIKAMEPLIAGNSCDQNNIKVINFAKPLVLLLSEHGIEKIEML